MFSFFFLIDSVIILLDLFDKLFILIFVDIYISICLYVSFNMGVVLILEYEKNILKVKYMLNWKIVLFNNWIEIV